MTLSDSVEKTIRNSKGEVEHQELRISATANSLQEAKDLDYKDFTVELIINQTTAYDVSLLFSKVGIFQGMVDGKMWGVEYVLSEREAREANNIEQLENK